MHYRDAASLATAYPRFGDFTALRDKLDPARVFANPYLDRVLG
jgi:L-gulonolactone oxidase